MESEVFHKARALHQAGRLDEAAAAYRLGLAKEPRSFQAYNDLGSILETQGKFDDAATAYSSALDIAPERALDVEPSHVECLISLAKMRHEQGQSESAIEWYARAVKCAPDSPEAHRYLGKALFYAGRFPQALEHYRQALELKPDDDGFQIALANCLNVLGRLEEAENAYRRVLELDPMSAAGHDNLGRVLQKAGKTAEAAAVFRQWLTLQPDNPSARHMLAACSGEEVPSRAEDDYVEAVFDQFAEHFDETLEQLGYRAPTLIAFALACETTGPNHALDVLDAGCGTGLCGPFLRPYARRLVGVDLSTGMLAKARERGCYDHLDAAELTAFLGDRAQVYDLIVCADTLVYFGELLPVLRNATAALRSDGLFVFTTELPEDPGISDDYRLNPQGRYCHTERYVDDSATRAGLSIRLKLPETLRYEAGRPVQGLLVAASPFTKSTEVDQKVK